MPSDGPPSDELRQHATTTEDLYVLLTVTEDTPVKDIYKAWRKTALKFHPDKNPDNPDAVAKFHSMTLARDVLSDPGLKATYDNARAAREQKKRKDAALDQERRAAKEKLERAEAGFKQHKANESSAEAKLRRIAEENARKRSELNLKRKRESLDAASVHSQSTPGTPVANGSPAGKAMKADLTGVVAADTPTNLSKSAGSGGSGSKGPSFSFTPKRGKQETLERLKAMQRQREEARIRQEEAAVEAAPSPA